MHVAHLTSPSSRTSLLLHCPNSLSISSHFSPSNLSFIHLLSVTPSFSSLPSPISHQALQVLPTLSLPFVPALFLSHSFPSVLLQQGLTSYPHSQSFLG